MFDGPTDDVAISYDADEETYRAQFDPDDIAPSLAVVEVVAHVRDVSPTDLDPLVHTVDPMAIDRLVDGNGDTDRTVQFRYLGHDVTVDSQGVVEVQTADAADD